MPYVDLIVFAFYLTCTSGLGFSGGPGQQVCRFTRNIRNNVWWYR